MFIYALTIFTGAFLLFQVQPLIGKYILPWFGGAPAVWTTCMLFFQMLLLGGYAYAHISSRRLKPRAQALGHLALVAAALALLPITPANSWKPDGSEDPTLRILALLAASIGLPYFALAATSPLMQHWYSRTHPGRSPYRLFALSNAGSLLALISYPVFFETQFTRTAQARLWGWGLALYAAGCVLCAIKLWKSKGVESRETRDEEKKSTVPGPWSPTLGPRPSALDRFLWLLLPACASVLLLAVTNMMCQEVAVIPFLWVLPLALYLLSFIICFDNPRWYARFPFALALFAAWGGICWVLFAQVTASITLQLGIYSAGLFIGCMVCHGELYRLRPDPRRLTGFYLMIAAGGALGGLFVAVIAPLIFTGYYELQWGLLLSGALFLAVLARERVDGGEKPGWKRVGNSQHRRRLALAGFSAGLAALGVTLWVQTHRSGPWTTYRTRNFYGVLTVVTHDQVPADMRFVELLHGRTIHGIQLADPIRADWPTTYFSTNSGVGLAMRALPAGSRRVGVVGLGAGTLATYARPGDVFHYYEINPEVERLAASRFTFLSDCRGRVEITTGDARLSLEREPPQKYDLLVLDAFNSDALPVHLVTGEAFLAYQRHVKTNGIIAVHVSNQSLNLEPVIIALARHFNYHTATIDYLPPADQPWNVNSVWMLMSHNEESIHSRAIRLAARPPQTNATSIALWTDDFTSLFQILHRGKPHPDIEFGKAKTWIAVKLCQLGDFGGAIEVYRAALRVHPDQPELLNNLAWLLATCPEPARRNGPEAVGLAEAACRLTRYHAVTFIGTLAAAYAEDGRYDDAIAMAEKACAMAGESGAEDWLKKNRDLLELYRAHQAYHEPAGPVQTKP